LNIKVTFLRIYIKESSAPLFSSPVVNIPNVKNTKLLTIVTNAKTEIVIGSLSRIVIKGILKFPALK